MESVQRPTKEQIRQWLADRWQSRAPLPDVETIRHQLGWQLVHGADQHPLKPD